MNKTKILTILVAVGALVFTPAITPAAARWGGCAATRRRADSVPIGFAEPRIPTLAAKPSLDRVGSVRSSNLAIA